MPECRRAWFQTVQKQVIGQFVRTLVAVGIVVRQAIVQQQLSAVAHRLGIRQPAAQIVSARIVGDILVELGRRVGIEIARQRIAIVVLIVFRQTALKRGNQHTAGPTAETVHPDQTARQVVAGGPIAGKAFQKVQDRPFDTGPPRQCRRRIAARHVVGLEAKRRTEHQRIVRVDLVLDARVEPMIEVFIKITAPDGFVYEFGGDVSYLEYFIPNNPEGITVRPRYITSWHLKSIVAPNQRRIDFEYVSVLQPNRYNYFTYFHSDIETNSMCITDPSKSTISRKGVGESKRYEMIDDIHIPIISQVNVDGNMAIKFLVSDRFRFYGDSDALSKCLIGIKYYHYDTEIRSVSLSIK